MGYAPLTVLQLQLVTYTMKDVPALIQMNAYQVSVIQTILEVANHYVT